MKGNGHLSQEDQGRVARLIQLHQETHPDRIAKRFNISGDYARRIWSKLPAHEQSSLSEALHALA